MLADDVGSRWTLHRSHHWGVSYCRQGLEVSQDSFRSNFEIVQELTGLFVQMEFLVHRHCGMFPCRPFSNTTEFLGSCVLHRVARVHEGNICHHHSPA